MVYFECMACNETIKKPKLKKHLEHCGSHYVTCIDCLKVFKWDEWESHTNCISEAQKYQGKLYEAKQSNNKGQQKQDTWIDNVQKIIEDPKSAISAHTRSNLEKLLGFTNIPRKQKPFANFVKNSLRMWDDKKIGEMWEVICSANAKPAQAPAAGAPGKDEGAAKEAAKAAEVGKKQDGDGEAPKPAKVCKRVLKEAAADDAEGDEGAEGSDEKPAKKAKKATKEADAEEEEEKAIEDKPAKKQKKAKEVPAEVWEGWTAAVEEELSASGGELPWPRLRELVVARCIACGADNGKSEESLARKALVEIAEEYLLVRRPSKSKRKSQ